jgi:N-methylhydantoinase B
MASKITGVKLRQGQRLRLESPGGGGWGAPETREPSRVAADVRNGFIDSTAASSLYRVALKPDGEVDDAATARLRAGRPA